MLKIIATFALMLLLLGQTSADPYSSLTPSEQELLKPQVDRWIRDQIKHDWSDMWEIQDQTPELKNEILLGHKDAPNLDRGQYVEAMKETINIGYPEIKAFRLQEVKVEPGGYLIWGCGEQRRELWRQISVTCVHAKVVNGKVLFGLHGGNPDLCKL